MFMLTERCWWKKASDNGERSQCCSHGTVTLPLNLLDQKTLCKPDQSSFPFEVHREKQVTMYCVCMSETEPAEEFR
jgi:hypothetical protein